MNDKKIFEELYYYGGKILDELQQKTNEKTNELQAMRTQNDELKDRHERFKKNLRALLNEDAPEEGNSFEY